MRHFIQDQGVFTSRSGVPRIVGIFVKTLLGDGHTRALLFIVVSGSRARRTERRNRIVHIVHEDFEHRSTKQLNRGINK